MTRDTAAAAEKPGMQARTQPPSAPLDLLRCPLTGTTLIEASAGTGKTWAICALVLRLLLERQLEIAQVLVITYTNAAAAELRDRIRSRLAEALSVLQQRAPGDAYLQALIEQLINAGHGRQALADRVSAALQGFDEASIFTTHGYCQRALADMPFTVGLPFAQEVLNDDKPLRLQVARDAWRRELTQDGAPPALAQAVIDAGDSPESWARWLQCRNALPLTRWVWPSPEVDAGGHAAPSGLEAVKAAHDRWAALHRQAVALWGNDRERVIAAVLQALPDMHKGRYRSADTVLNAAIHWDTWLAGHELPAEGGKPDEAARLGAAKLADGKAPPAVLAHPFHRLADDWLAARAACKATSAALRLQLMRRLVEEGPAALQALKREQRVLSFDDMLTQLYQRLVGSTPGDTSAANDRSGLAAVLRQRYPAALIDEFQDTDPVQWAIVRAVYQPAQPSSSVPLSLFLVGDPKQAIYRFRHADLHTYLAARDTAQHRATLTRNQRSSAELLAALNTLWSNHPQAFAMHGLGYDAVQVGEKPRKPWLDQRPEARPEARAALQIWTLPRESPDLPGVPLTKPGALAAAAAACAGEVAQLLAAGQRGEVLYDNRPLVGGDVAVLVRSHGQGQRMRRALQALGVASVELSQASVLDSPDAEAVHQVMAAVAEPTRLPLLRTALASIWLGYDASAIDAWSHDETAVQRWVDRCTAWRALWCERGVVALLRRLWQEEAVVARLLARPDGERRLTNGWHLVDCLHAAETTLALRGAPERLLAWLDQQRHEPDARDPDDAQQLRLESDRQLVQIVTIHRSKGLEYPVVFLPFAWDPGSHAGRDDGPGIAHRADGEAVIDLRPEAVGHPRIKAQRREEAFAEDLRLLYVALTRAVHRCVLVVGSFHNRTSAKVAIRSPVNWLVGGQAWAGGSLATWDAMEVDKTKSKSKAHALPGTDMVLAAWSNLAGAACREYPAAASCGPMSIGPWAAVTLPRPVPGDIAALPMPAGIPAPWRIGSFSSLMRGAGSTPASAVSAAAAGPALADDARDEEADLDIAFAAVDHDRVEPVVLAQRGDDEGDDPMAAPGAPSADATGSVGITLYPGGPSRPSGVETAPAADDILRFPRGPDAGTCLHGVFEFADFADPDTWPGAIDRALQRATPEMLIGLAEAAPLQPGWRPSQPATHTTADPSPHATQDRGLAAAMLHRMLADVMATPLPGAATLGSVTVNRRLVEWPFHLPAHGVTVAALQAVLRQHGFDTPALTFSRLQGYLQGVVDLVFEHDGRYFVVDWKSNHLGWASGDYGSESRAAAMREHGYTLQALLYAVALHRHLQDRLPGYRFGSHFGGVRYLFVRGMRPAWRDATGQPLGIEVLDPPEALVAALSDLFSVMPAWRRDTAEEAAP